MAPETAEMIWGLMKSLLNELNLAFADFVGLGNTFRLWPLGHQLNPMQ